MWECSVDESTGTLLPNSAFWLLVVFCSGFRLLQTDEGEDYTPIYGFKDKCIQTVVRDCAGLVN